MQLPLVEVAAKVQVTGDPEEGVAVIVTCAPEISDVRSKVGVLSAVVLSEFEEPVSEADARSGIEAELTVVVKGISETRERFPVLSRTTT